MYIHILVEVDLEQKIPIRLCGYDYAVGNAPKSVALGDWNGDGFVDLIIANSGNNTVSVMLGNGSGSFSSTNSLNLAVGNGPTAIALSDVNSDGLLDFVTANAISNTVTVSINGVAASGSTSGGRFYTYDPVFNKVTSETDELGRQTLYQIDPNNGNLLSTTKVVSNGSNVVTKYTYTSTGQIATITDPLGRVTAYNYDNVGNLKTITFAQGTPDQAVQTFEYDAAGNQTASIDEKGNRTEFKYDAMNRLYQTTYAKGTPDEAVQKIQYDNSGNQAATIDEAGNSTQYKYDAMNRLSTITAADPDGSGPLTSPVTTYTYDFAGNQVLVVDPLLRPTQYHYDSRNRLFETINPDGGHLRQGYDFDNHRTSSTDANGNQTIYVYDARGRLIRQRDPLQNTTRFDYDAANQMVSLVDGNGHRQEFKYDDLGRRPTVIDAPNTSATTTRTTQYDANGNVIAQIDGLQHATKYSYDNRDRQIVVTDALSKSTKTQYDAVGNVLSVTDPDINTTSYTYDARNRRKTETNQLGNTRSVGYDLIGNQTSMIDRDGRKRTFTYDALNRQTAEKWFDASNTLISTISSTYDAASELTDISDPNSAYHYTYDANGRLASVDNAGTPGVPNVVLKYTHDFAGNLLTTTDTISGQLKGTEAYTYDPLNRVKSITQSGNGVTDKRVNISYNAIGQMTSLSRYTDLLGTQLVASSTYAYDPAERLLQLTHSKGATTLADYTWGYDNANRITSFTSPDGTSTYTYDLSNQLTGASNTNESYIYDANGNRTNTGYSTGSDNQLQSDGKYTYTYDNEGNRYTRTEITTGQVTSYTWDYRNRLTSVVDKNASGNFIDAIAYTYDVNDRRIAKTVTTGTGTQVEHMVYDGDNIALTFDGGGNQTHRYLYRPEADRVLADENASGQVLWALTDNQGTVRDLIDSTGAVANHIKYDSFGNITSQTNPAVNFRYGYTGQEFDKETGQYYYRARYYDAGIGRFLSEDPIGFDSGDANLYRYVGNRPLDHVDPFGTYGEIVGFQVRVILYTGVDNDGNIVNKVTGNIEDLVNERLRPITNYDKVSIWFDNTLAFIKYSPDDTGIPIKDRPPDIRKKEYDDAGHIVPSQLGGQGDLNNAYAINRSLNRGQLQKHESRITILLDEFNAPGQACGPQTLTYAVGLSYKSIQQIEDDKKVGRDPRALRPIKIRVSNVFLPSGMFAYPPSREWDNPGA